MVTPENAFEPTDDASRLAGTRSFSHHSQMHVDALRDALAMVILGVGCFSSDRYLSECHRQFTGNVRASGAPGFELREAGLRRAAVFLTFGAVLSILGIAIAGKEAVGDLLRQ